MQLYPSKYGNLRRGCGTIYRVWTTIKLKLKSRIEALKLNSQYDSQATAEEQAKIDSWYGAVQ